jgi:hypothetical protein
VKLRLHKLGGNHLDLGFELFNAALIGKNRPSKYSDICFLWRGTMKNLPTVQIYGFTVFLTLFPIMFHDISG